MQLILDNVAAVIILGLLLTAAAVVQLRGQQASIEASVHDMAKARAESLVQVLGTDLENMGAGSDPAAGNEASASYDESSPQHFECNGAHDGARTTRFHFSGLKNPEDTSSTEPADLTYALSPDTTAGGAHRTVRIGPTDAPLYRVQRFEDGVPAGGSGGLLTHFQIEIQTHDSKGAFVPVNGDCGGDEDDRPRAVRLTFVAALPTVERTASDQVSTSGLNASRYGTTVRPPGMDRF